MSQITDGASIASIEALEALYSAPSPAAKSKRVPTLSEAVQGKLQASSLCVIASVGSTGVDCSPRGDAPGNLVQVIDERTLAIPDRAGSRRLDTAKNVIQNGRVAAWFLSSDWRESVRISGRAYITVDPTLLNRCALDGELPITVMVIEIDHVAIHNDRAVRSSGLMA